jgi:hypothetical protein
MNASGPSADLTCPNCESPVRAGAWFCSTCGFDLLAHAPKQADPPNAENAAQPQDPPTADSADQPDTENAARPEEPTATFTARLRARAEQTLRQVGYRKVIVVVGVVGVIVALVLGSGHVVRSQAAEGPEPLVQALFTALANRDEVKARELDVCANSPVCVPGSLDRGYEPPDDLQIKRVAYGEPNPNDPTRRPDKNHAIVQASYRVGAETHDDTFFLRRSSQVSEAGVESRTWSFENPVGRHVSLRSQYATLVRVAGSQTQLKTAEPGGRAVFRTLWLLPGSYEVAGVSNVLFGTSAVLMTVGGRDTCVPEPGSSTIVAGMTSPLEGNTSVHILNDCKGLETTINLTLKRRSRHSNPCRQKPTRKRSISTTCSTYSCHGSARSSRTPTSTEVAKSATSLGPSPNTPR